MSKVARTAVAAIGMSAAMAVSVGVAATPAQGAAAKAAAAKARACSTAWGTGQEATGPASAAAVFQVRTGQNECYDRVVFQFDGSTTGYAVTYTDRVNAEDSGRNLVPYTAGEAYLRVRLRAPSNLVNNPGDHVANVFRYQTLRDVVYGGETTNRTTFVVGVRNRLPFRVFTLTGPGDDSRIVLDVAHRR